MKELTEQRWYAVHTKYKCEKYVVNALTKKSVEAYTPTLKTITQYERKTVRRELPLINCYVFVRVNKEEFVKVLQTEYVYAFLKIGREINPIKQEEIDILKRVTGELNDISVSEKEYVEGMSVEVIAGNLTGIKGKLIEKQGKHNFLVELDSIAYQLKINIDPAHLRPIQSIGELILV